MTPKRAGRTVKVSVSLAVEELALLRRHALAHHDGNLSAAFADAARWVRQREARAQLIEALGGPTLTPEARAAIDEEQAGVPRSEPKKPRRGRAA